MPVAAGPKIVRQGLEARGWMSCILVSFQWHLAKDVLLGSDVMMVEAASMTSLHTPVETHDP
ncbi:hypothetical protein BRADI_1g37629v3 [Brachypodium distachyon]|uniref:Uncharacterized protein n=1 Tax=Brachypodium distachyon TaxID=15368 RepID=A0A2K2DN87_BRADI|nr:hypothetical protein BRADI_1g37629v3 [Brachypodium distachyon]